MGQVPVSKNGPRNTKQANSPRILIVGRGRVAQVLLEFSKHQSAATLSSQFTVSQWHRGSPGNSSGLSETLTSLNPSHVWLAISDDSIASVAEENFDDLVGRTVVHFSGGKSGWTIERAGKQVTVHCAHPLTTFGGDVVESAKRFATVPFVLDRGAYDETELASLLPGFTNPVVRINPVDREYYHALCALAGGLTVSVWEAVQKRFQSELGLDPQVLATYRSQVFQNLTIASPDRSVLTGPVARGDSILVAKHLAALERKLEAPLLSIYNRMIDLFRTEKSRAETKSRKASP